ncbi:hypothetical protein [Qipengyuania sp. MTN3-11]|uniref:hypothetical protein n=1 Tax=Qipengyuania sp. MTN3-11 TaxID=3056557 RepID=UPI0036F28160
MPAAATVDADDDLVIDRGSAVQKAKPLQVINAAIPLATQAEAEAGTDNQKRMTALRVKQAIDALGGGGGTSPLPARVDFIATEGQERFPATGYLEDLEPPFYMDEAAEVQLNGQPLNPAEPDEPDYVRVVEDGGTYITVAQDPPIEAGDWISIHSQQLSAMENDSILKRAVFSIGKSARDKMSEAFALDDIPLGNDSTDANRLATALDDGRRNIRLPANGGSEDGVWRFGSSPWRIEPVDGDFDDAVESKGNLTADGTNTGAAIKGLTIFGDGPGRTQVRQDTLDNYLFSMNCMSEDPEDNFDDIVFRDFTILGPCMNNEAISDGVRDVQHMIAAFGVSNLVIDNVHAFAPAGDFLWLANSPDPSKVRYNTNATIMRCVIDGLWKNNRNAISVESGDGVRILMNEFVRLTKIGWPGPIDFEPFAQDPVYRNRQMLIALNRFLDFNGGALCVYSAAGVYDLPASGFTFTNNFVDGSAPVGETNNNRCLDISGSGEDSNQPSNIRVSHNEVKSVGQPFRAIGANGVDISDNVFMDCGSALLGVNGAIDAVNYEVAFNRNKCIRVGQDNGAVILAPQRHKRCEMHDNRLIDCGRTDGEAGFAYLNTSATTAGMSLRNNLVYNDAGLMKVFAGNSQGDSVYAEGAAKKGNELVAGAAFTGADSYNPPISPAGANATETLTGPLTLASKASTTIDKPVAGAKVNMAFDVTVDWAPAAGEFVIAQGVGYDTNALRIVLFNPGSASITIPSGTVITAIERA